MKLLELRKKLAKTLEKMDLLKQIHGLHSISAELDNGRAKVTLWANGQPGEKAAIPWLVGPFMGGSRSGEPPPDFELRRCPPPQIHDAFQPIASKGPLKTDQLLRLGMAVQKGSEDGYGSLGWMFRSGSALHFVSNWHVLCGEGNATTEKQRVSVSDGGIRPVGRIRSFIPVHPCSIADGPDAWNTHDCAVAELDAKVEASFDSFEVGSRTFTYPTSLVDLSEAEIGEEYYRLGASTRALTNLVGIGVLMLTPSGKPYDPEKPYTFKDQLIFRKSNGTAAAEGGDSGSVFVRASDGAVAAVQFAIGGADKLDGYASPLAPFEWMVGESAGDGPVLTGDPFQKPPWTL